MATVPSVMPAAETDPLEFNVTGIGRGDEVLVPKTMMALRFDDTPLAIAPAVATVMLHGLITSVLPKPSGEDAGNDEVVMVKMHEP